MAKSIKGTQTEKNLLAAFAGESQARNRYTFFAKEAAKAGYEQISKIFLETAENERHHAKIFFKHLEGGDVTITASYPAGVIGDTKANLQAAAEGEKLEWSVLYPEAAKVAREEGFVTAALDFDHVAHVEKFHEERYRKLVRNFETGQVFQKPVKVRWHCIECGAVYEGEEAPRACPVCKHPQGIFEVLAENY